MTQSSNKEVTSDNLEEANRRLRGISKDIENANEMMEDNENEDTVTESDNEFGDNDSITTVISKTDAKENWAFSED